MNQAQQARLLSYSIIVFMSMMFITLMMVLFIQIDHSIGDIVPIGTMMLLMIIPILAYIVFNWIAVTTVKRIYTHLDYVQDKDRDKGNGQIPDDLFMGWMRIIFSKED